MRFLAVVLMTTFALVPPGFCLCRLTAELVHEHTDCPEDDTDHERDCECPQLLPDCTVPTNDSAEQTLLTAPLTELAETPLAVVVSAALAAPSFLDDAATPLYLALRALRL